jgi:ribonucleoside-triphosphate reductase
MAIYKVKKRNGAIVTFDRDKIYEAIKKAIKSVGGDDYSEVDQLVQNVGFNLEEKI